MARGLGKMIVKDSDAKQNPGSSHVKKEDPSPSPVNLGDQAGLKRGLDDCAVSVRSSCFVMYICGASAKVAASFLSQHGWILTCRLFEG
jgi:hypothetical protein